MKGYRLVNKQEIAGTCFNGFSAAVNYFCKNFHLRYLIAFWINRWERYSTLLSLISIYRISIMQQKRKIVENWIYVFEISWLIGFCKVILSETSVWNDIVKNLLKVVQIHSIISGKGNFGTVIYQYFWIKTIFLRKE